MPPYYRAATKKYITGSSAQLILLKKPQVHRHCSYSRGILAARGTRCR